MATSDRIAGVLCIAFAALLKAGAECAGVIAEWIEAAGMNVAHPGSLTYTHRRLDFSTTGTWSTILLLLGIVLIVKSLVYEIREIRAKRSGALP